MDYYDNSQPTQATQNVVDPRRLGQQNSGLSDEDISDIICILMPYSDGAREEVKRIAEESSNHMLARDETENIDLDYQLEDEAENFGLVHQDVGKHHIALRFSSQVKNPAQGFTFGRNPSRCDICLLNDPARRLSNIHFRIYINEHGILMLEDTSTNGTVVDDTLLKHMNPPGPTKRTLTSGTKIKILMKHRSQDLIFLVRIPRREGAYLATYQRNLEAYVARYAPQPVDTNETIVPGPGGHVSSHDVSCCPITDLEQVDIFQTPAQNPPVANWPARRPTAANTGQHGSVSTVRIHRSWNGSDKYNRVGEIGRGAFATVHKVTSKFDGLPYAAKELDKTKFMKNGVLDQKVENEMKIMQRVKHPNIVQYVEHLDWDDRLMIIIMEYIPGGDLGKLIAEVGPLPEFATRMLARQLLDALGYLHQMNITHRDVKPDNILVSSRDPFVVKLTDFGLSKMIENEETFLRTFCGTLLYCAPEVYSEFTEYDEFGRRNPRNRRHRHTPGQRYDHAVDVWSLGGVLFYALTKRPPYPAKNGATYSELLHQIMTRPLDKTPLFQAGVSEMGVDFLLRMLHKWPETRATVEALQDHPWVNGPGLTESFDEVSDEELRIEASQLSLQEYDRERTVDLNDELIPASDDEIVDNDENDPNGYGSEKENYTFGPGNEGARGQPQRLFGEVNISAIGSSGAIPVDRLNLPVSMTSSGTTEILGAVTEIRDSFDSSDDSFTPRQKSNPSQPNSGHLRTSVLLASQSKSVNELNNMTFNVESQSLGGTESHLEHLNMMSRPGSLLRSATSDLNTSKRKPSLDSSDEMEPPSANNRRVLKRLRSENSVESLSSIDEVEYELFAHIPNIARAQSGRQIDTPVNKSTFWTAEDRTTWHLQYPEMTQLQYDAFKAAATARGEDFGPGKTPLWDLAVKYFPPTLHEEHGSMIARARGDDNMLPSTAIVETHNMDSIPDTQDPTPRVTMPIQWDPFEKRIVAILKSAPGSAVTDMSVNITESMVSWGRATENTQSYSPKSEAKVPKYAFRILLWKENYDPCRNFRPWNRMRQADESSFYFYISTKATNGIYINGEHLPSVQCKTPSSPSTYWMRLHDNDSVVVWQTTDGSCRSELTFRCDWGGSGRPRTNEEPPTIEPEAVAKRLDELCGRAEKKMRNLSEHDFKLEEAHHDVSERQRHIEQERDRSRVFELKRQEVCRALAARRGSPAPHGAHADSQGVQVTRLSNRTVPQFRTGSANAIDPFRGRR
ncbi:hypothetical protein QBC47DRAFT_421589 [Echria macrotheca]|uniref:Autophagy-related protein 1 n=1 Tax=Echria macrotheca TaxID=438768 RepID=A0AAJ0BG39_9PEZI|nr:hypothetical protein QBC47DRAFT_421589 [Echria macrotheca]